MSNRGRPKGKSDDTRSFGPLGDLLRKHRLAKAMGLSEVADATGVSVQFISNIEHGRAPLPWDKAPGLASLLKIPMEALQAANLAVRHDFKSFASTTPKGKRIAKPQILKNMAAFASVISIASNDSLLQEVIQKYQGASNVSRKKFLQTALELLNS